jgi:hypothetical protein
MCVPLHAHQLISKGAWVANRFGVCGDRDQRWGDVATSVEHSVVAIVNSVWPWQRNKVSR